MNKPQAMTIEACLARLRSRLSDGRRLILGVAGAPGSGKSTFAQALMEALPGQAMVVPMDGYHLANVELARLNRRDRKGAEDTFDSAGYVALLARLRDRQADEIVYAPAFCRDIDEPIAGAIAVPAAVQLVIAEGNYLLLDQGHWSKVRNLLDEAWYLDLPAGLRQERLAARHMHFGRDEQSAQAWVRQTDEPNAVLIESTRERADLVFRWAGI